MRSSGIPNTIAHLTMIAIVALTSGSLRFLRWYPEDDALIHLRVAQHWVDSGYPWFNYSMPVESSTSLGWLSLLAILGYCGIPLTTTTLAVIETVVVSLSVLLWGHLCLLFVPTAPRWLSLLASWSVIITAGFTLMETPLACLCGGLAILFGCRRSVLGLPLAVGAAAIRPEYAVLAPLIIILFRPMSRRALALSLGSAAGVAVLVFEAKRSLYGSLGAHTASVKRTVYQVPPDAALMQYIQNLGGYPSWLAYGLLIVIAIVLSKLSVLVHSLPRPVAGLAIGAVIIIATSLCSGVPLFPWYPVLSGILLVPLLLHTCSTSDRVLRLAGCGLVFIGIGWSTTTAVLLSSGTRLPWMLWLQAGARTRWYTAVGHTLYQRCSTASVVAAEIGGLGIGFKGDIIDAIGLASPGSVAYHPLPIPEERTSPLQGGIPRNLIRHTKPDVIVGYPSFLKGVLGDTGLMSEYATLSLPLTYPSDQGLLRDGMLWGNKELLVLVRRDSDHCDEQTLSRDFEAMKTELGGA